jgi:hypothetical protein
MSYLHISLRPTTAQSAPSTVREPEKRVVSQKYQVVSLSVKVRRDSLGPDGCNLKERRSRTAPPRHR